VKQSVTTACHHCLDPACMNGCPVGAYEKDPLTGIVSHLDDQCIGCQYCTFTCPYEVPQYNAERGIVRKCDMCKGRLAEGEAPACVQACPNEAIAITLVDRRQALEDAQGDAFLPGAPSPAITVPTTIYRTERALPRNMLPANFYAVRPSHQHTPLVIMLVLTQLSVGAFWLDAVARRFDADAVAGLGPTHTLVAVAVGLAALGASVAHLGRPMYAFRALLGLRTSWMSREILAFGVFAPLAIAYAAAPLWSGPLAAAASPAVVARTVEMLRDLVALAGLAGVVCSVLIYHVTRRAWWNASRTAFKFFATAVVLGLATTVLTFSVSHAGGHTGPADASPLAALTALLSRALVAASAAKLAVELSFLRHLRDKRYGELRRTAHLMTRDLARYTTARFALLAVGGVLLPLGNGQGAASPWLAGASFVLLVAGELLERTLFFAASSSPGMPGGVG
jgi:Fe-S-cluster-containing dehydrogenase component/DMSO reductase anchor subunit